jgi:hypothetical protein
VSRVLVRAVAAAARTGPGSQGLATIDGAGALYPFRLDARDGTPERLILRVWAPGADPATAEPLYKASGDVSGGTVTIHR